MSSLFTKKDIKKCILQEEEWNNIKCPNCEVKLIVEKITEYGEYKCCPICNQKHLLIRKIPINEEWIRS